jgi:hypothetical protein
VFGVKYRQVLIGYYLDPFGIHFPRKLPDLRAV